MFYPEPPYEDAIVVQKLWTQNIVSRQFAASVLDGRLPEPGLLPVRDRLLQYANQITKGKADGQDIPNQFAALVQSAASGQRACGSTDLTKCTAEQQFAGYWAMAQQPDWTTQFASILSGYLSTVAGRLATNGGDYLTLVTSRQEQFQNYAGVCNLYEFDLFLSCNTMVGTTFYRMNSDGTLSPQPGYSCPTRRRG
jgi:hypothetical protein